MLFQIIGCYSLGLFSQNLVDVYINQPAVLIANAGADTTVQEGAAIQIGGSPTASNGYGSYTYAWAPADNLSDASVSNPEVTVQNSMIYVVTVSDVMECTSIDTIAVTVTGTTDILNQWVDPGIKIMPNPNQGIFIIELENPTLLPGIDIIVRDITGKKVYNRITGIQEGKNRIPVNISSLPKGTYAVEIYNESLHYIRKLIVY